MMIVRRANQRQQQLGSGYAQTRTFRARESQRVCRVRGGLQQLEETWLAPSAGLPLSNLEHVELVSYAREGELAFDDDQGHSTRLQAGEFQRSVLVNGASQRMRNHSRTVSAQCYQLRFADTSPALPAPLERQRFSTADRRGCLRLIAAQGGLHGSLHMQQDVSIFSSLLESGRHLVHALTPGRSAWLHVLHGQAVLSELTLSAGDAVGVVAEHALSFTAVTALEILLVDIAQS